MEHSGFQNRADGLRKRHYYQQFTTQNEYYGPGIFLVHSQHVIFEQKQLYVILLGILTLYMDLFETSLKL